ncbi:MAG: hypothetical protein GYA77_00080 [Candidatus Cloacimonetes bacterium]|jgi:hypothetical protein|nr:hypothetical protein [Candidatus Cloacimonadota bacterium]
MTNKEKMLYERESIRQALVGANVMEVAFNKDDIPKQLPAAIVVLEGETGTKGTSRRYLDTDIAWTVFLIVNASNERDPDARLYELKESFRENYQRAMYRDIPEVEYYTSRIDGSRLVRIAKINLLKSGTGAGA